MELLFSNPDSVIVVTLHNKIVLLKCYKVNSFFYRCISNVCLRLCNLSIFFVFLTFFKFNKKILLKNPEIFPGKYFGLQIAFIKQIKNYFIMRFISNRIQQNFNKQLKTLLKIIVNVNSVI